MIPTKIPLMEIPLMVHIICNSYYSILVIVNQSHISHAQDTSIPRKKINCTKEIYINRFSIIEKLVQYWQGEWVN